MALNGPEVTVVSLPLHTSVKNGIRTSYYSCLEIDYHSSSKTTTTATTTSTTSNGPYHWKVYLGDVVAVSTEASPLTLSKLDEWEPNHYHEQSHHWKIGLVVGLTLVATTKVAELKCSVQWLEKALDTPHAKKLRATFRPKRKNDPISQMPHVLLSTNTINTIDAKKILPVTITMLTQAEFNSKKGVEDALEDRFSLQFCCPKRIGVDGNLISENPDPWALFNTIKTMSSSASENSYTVPAPLQHAWSKCNWKPPKEIPVLLQILIKGYRESRHKKQKTYAEERRRAVLEEQQQQQQQQIKEKEEPSGRKRKTGILASSSERKGKKIRIREPHEVPERHHPAKPNATKKKSLNGMLTSIMKKKKKKKETKQTATLATATSSRSSSSNNKINHSKQKQKQASKSKSKTTKGSTTKKNSASKKAKPNASKSNRKAKTTTTMTTARGKYNNKETNQPGTPSTASSSSSFFLAPSSRSGRTNTIVPRSELVHSGKLQARAKKFYESVSMTIDTSVLDGRNKQPTRTNKNSSEPENFRVGVGQMVAVRSEDAVSNHWSPFCVRWGVAQVVAICNDIESEEWEMSIRWLYRYSELTPEEQEQAVAADGFSKADGLLEKMEVDLCPLEAVLPAHVQLTSDELPGELLPEIRRNDGLPILRFQCKHLQKGNAITRINDWNNYCARMASIPEPLTRGLRNNHKSLAEKYRTQIATRAQPFSLNVVPLTPQPMVERGGQKFYDGIRLDIDSNSLSKSIRPRTKKWTLRVGYVVPICCQQDPLDYFDRSESKSWYPFAKSWSAGQVVSIFRTESGEWMMQIRWFNRFRDLIHRQKRGLDCFDKAHVVFETEEYCDLPVTTALPGRIILTSCDSDDWNSTVSSATGLPIIPHLCAHICLDQYIQESTDWTNYDLELRSYPSALARGLLQDPIDRNNKELILTLSRYYKKFVKLRDIEPDEEIFRKWSEQGRPLMMKKDGVKFDPKNVSVRFGSHLAAASLPSQSTREFCKNLTITAPIRYIASPTMSMKRMKKHGFSCSVGDVVCFQDDKAKTRDDHILMKNVKHPWFPFTVSWSFGQVLSVYRDVGNGLAGAPYVEIRRFYRAFEVPNGVKALMPPTSDGDKEEVFESDDIVEALPASTLLATADIYMGHFDRAVNQKTYEQSSIQGAACRCQYFYLTAHRTLQPVISSSFSAEIWFDQLRERGFHLSNMIKQFKNLGSAMPSSERQVRSLDVNILLGEPSVEQMISVTPLDSTAVSQKRFPRRFLDVSLLPVWSNFECYDLFFRQKDQRERWKVSIGDFVALNDPKAPKQASWYPYKEPWVPCQVVAIYTDSMSANDCSISLESLHFELKLLKILNSRSKSDLAEVCDQIPLQSLKVRAIDLQGPLILYQHYGNSEIDCAKLRKHLPYAPYWASTALSRDLAKALKDSSLYEEGDIAGVLGAVGVELGNFQNLERSSHAKVKPGDAWTSVAPLHVDLSRNRAYFSELNLVPEYFKSDSQIKKIKPWRVRMGDVVLVHCDGGHRYPMTCNWEDFGSYEELERSQEAPSKESGHGVNVEIRWFYERSHIKGISKSESSWKTDELFETDHVDVIDAAKGLLAPARLLDHKDNNTETMEDFMGKQIQSFVCRRFWSTTRKALIPCGNLGGRQKRGWLYSKVLPEEIQQKATTAGRVSRDIIIEETASLTWTESMARIIGKLTLKDASRGAYEDGTSLIGRERELHKLLTFFRAAVRGDAGTGGVKSSMFIAGPPGVGKTACVRAAIARLRLEQAMGDVPKFNFISLNGMEMRHPFEAYVKFWEALTGRKHVGSHEKACEKLEGYFTSPLELKESEGRTVSVVLLDEIDYLITEKQSVLYNFFDWPKRAAELTKGRRLVVVGISNTLNLAEQLMPSVQSRVGSERCYFKAYNLKDTVAILKSKIQEASTNCTMFEDDSILFAAKKTAALSGDIRKAFQICRAAAEQVLQNFEAEKENKHQAKKDFPKVRISDVQKASRESFNMALVTAVSFATSFQALLLISLASLRRSTGREVGGFDIKDIMMKMEALAGASGDPQYSPPPSFGETIHLLNRLGELDLIELRTQTSTATSFRSSLGGSGGAWPLSSLAVDEHTLTRGLKNTPHKALAEKNLPSSF